MNILGGWPSYPHGELALALTSVWGEALDVHMILITFNLNAFYMKVTTIH